MGSTLNVLTALKLVGAHASVSDLADFFDEHDQKSLSARLCRMRSKGYCASEMKDNKNLWTLTQKGQRELEKLQELHQQPEPQINPELDSEPQPTSESEPEPQPILESELQTDQQPDQQPEPEFVSEHEYEPDPIARELLEAMELELALDDVKWRLQAARIPARTARVYREIVAALPHVLQKTLEPLTALIESAH